MKKSFSKDLHGLWFIRFDIEHHIALWGKLVKNLSDPAAREIYQRLVDYMDEAQEKSGDQYDRIMAIRLENKLAQTSPEDMPFQ